MDFIRRRKKIFIIGLCVLSLFLMAFTGRGGYMQGPIRSSIGSVFTSTQALFSNIGNWFSDRFEFLSNMSNLQRENAELQGQIDALQAQLNSMLHLQEENIALSSLVNLHRHYDHFQVVAADIISHNPSNWSDSFIINVGQNRGIAVDMAVLAPGGLAGRVSAVGFNYAVVTPLLEDGAAVSSQGQRTGDWGMVSGDINLASLGLLRMDYIHISAGLATGDAVITSHLSSIYPPGVMIGHVVDIGQGVGNMLYATVRPNVDFSSISSVLVITDIFDEHASVIDTWQEAGDR